MKNCKSIAGLATAFILISLFAIGASAQGAKNAHVVPVPAGTKTKVTGVVSMRNGDMFKVRDLSGAETVIVLTPESQVTSHKKWSGKTDYSVTYIMRGLRLQAQGKGDANGNLVAD